MRYFAQRSRLVCKQTRKQNIYHTPYQYIGAEEPTAPTESNQGETYLVAEAGWARFGGVCFVSCFVTKSRHPRGYRVNCVGVAWCGEKGREHGPNPREYYSPVSLHAPLYVPIPGNGMES